MRKDSVRQFVHIALGLALPTLIMSARAAGTVPSRTLLPSYGPWGDQTYMHGLSPDGLTVIGFGLQTATAGSQRTLLWRASTGMQMVPGLDSRESYIQAVNFDATTLTGIYSVNVTSEPPFVYTPGAGVRPLAVLSTYDTYPSGMSRDGRFIAGEGRAPGPRAVRWDTVTGAAQVLPAGPSGLLPNGSALISADGSVMVGIGTMPGGQVRVFRWTDAGGAEPVVPIPADHSDTLPLAMSPDGSIILGAYRRNPYQYRPWLWSASGGLQMLPSSPAWGLGTTMSADGSIVGGDGVFWTPQDGLQDTATFFAQRGLPNAPGYCRAISDDGTAFLVESAAGFSYITIPAPGAAVAITVLGFGFAARVRRRLARATS